MVDQVRRFLDAGLARAAGAGERQLDALLADLLGDPGRPFAEQAGGVALLRIGAAALVDDTRELLQPADAGRGRFAEKQLVVPRWQAGPAGSARTSKASSSQSAKIALTAR